MYNLNEVIEVEDYSYLGGDSNLPPIVRSQNPPLPSDDLNDVQTNY